MASGKTGGSPLLRKVTSELLARIRAGEWAEGTRLPAERRLAEELEVSRPVVREALKQLAHQGLVDIRHGSGVRVCSRLSSPLSESVAFVLPGRAERLRAMMQARMLLEPGLAALAAAEATAAQMEGMQDSIDELRAAATPAAAEKSDARFHRLVAEAAGNKIALLMLESFANLGREVRAMTHKIDGVEVAVSHHGRILNAILRRRPRQAESLMRAHLAHASGSLEAQLRRDR